MLRLALIFLLIALVAGMFNLAPLSGPLMNIAQILFMIFLVLAIVSFVGGLLNRTGRTDLI